MSEQDTFSPPSTTDSRLESKLPEGNEESSLLDLKTDGKKTKKISTGELIMLTFFWTTGGPFGIESAVRAGGPMYTMIGLTIIIVFWCLPQGLMSAELALLVNTNGGVVVWVQRAFGNFVGYVAALSSVALNITNLSVLVVLYLDYIGSAIFLEVWQRWLASALFVVVITFINLKGVEWVSKLSIPILVIVFIPFVTEFIMIFVMHKPVYWDDVDLGILIGNVVWAFGAFDSMGVLAGDIEGGTSTYVLGLAGTLPLILLTYIFPITLGFLVYPQRELWQVHAFTDIAFSFTPSLGLSMVAASALSHFGQYNANLASTAWQVWAMGGGKDTKIAVNRYLPSFFSETSAHGIPYIAILSSAAISFVLTSLDYNFLIQIYLVLRLVIVFSEYASLIYLKWKEPETLRPYSVPGGKIGAISLLIPTMAISGLALATADHSALMWGGGTTLVIICSYPLQFVWQAVYHKYSVWKASNTTETSQINEP